MHYNNIMNYYPQNMYNTDTRQVGRVPRPNPGFYNRPGGSGFLLPFALGFATSPLILGNRPRPPYYGPYYPYYPYY